MGTRADFYVGRGKGAEWLGSIAWDGYWDGIDQQITQCTSEPAFRHAVAEFIGSRDDGTKPEDGWPWPWDDSGTTDCVYAFDGGKVWQEYDDHWIDGTKDFGSDEDKVPANAMKCEHPDMTARKNVQWGAKSGLLILGAKS